MSRRQPSRSNSIAGAVTLPDQHSTGADVPTVHRLVIARAPTRLDFGGGWTDVPPYCDEKGGVVCNVAITRYATARVSATAVGGAGVGDSRSSDLSGTALLRGAAHRAGIAADAGVHATIESDFPVGAGLGGSSAAGVALAAALAAWNGEHPTPAELAERSREVEVEDVGIAGGRQDHYAAASGGAQLLHFGVGAAVRTRALTLSAGCRTELQRRGILAYTGEARVSGATITGVMNAFVAGDPAVVRALARMKELAALMATALVDDDVDSLAALIGEHWIHQRSLHPAIATPRIDRLLEAADRAGAGGGKALGASGGGCVLILAGPDNVERVRQAVAREATLLPFSLDFDGFRLLRS